MCHINAMKDELNLIELAQKYSDEDKARDLMESLLWPNGPVCPHCKNHKEKAIYRLTPKPGSKTRKGICKCGACRKQFTVTVGTIFEDSHLPISKWLMAIFILCSSKKSISANQLSRMLNVSYKAAWFMNHRLRFAMTPGKPLAQMLEGTVEIDETYVGGKPRHGTGPHKRGRGTTKTPVVALIQRDGTVRTKVVAGVNKNNLREFLHDNIARSATINTDEFTTYLGLFKGYERHDVVKHNAKEYARHNLDGTVSHTNTCESFFSLLKRGVYGAWHHVSKEHLSRYTNEFAFRWDTRGLTDSERMKKLLPMAQDKRLTYRQVI